MPETQEHDLLTTILDSWDRNNTILTNLVRLIPEGCLDARAIDGSPTVGEMLAHIHYVRLVFVEEDAPEFARTPVDHEREWVTERDPYRLVEMLNQSAKAVREAVKGKIAAGQQMKQHYDHPILFLQHMIWHEGYHHGQIKLALKLVGHPITNKQAGPVTWRVWMNKQS